MATIEERLQELTERVSAAEAALAAQKRRQILRDSLTCPGCAGTEIFHIAQLMTYGLPVRVSQEGVFSIKSIGTLEVYLCSACGYGEVQIDPSQLRDREHVNTISNATAPTTPEPYR